MSSAEFWRSIPRSESQHRRAAELAPLREEMKDRGVTWKQIRGWAIGEIDAGRRSWKPADVPLQTPNIVVVRAYLDANSSTAPEGARA